MNYVVCKNAGKLKGLNVDRNDDETIIFFNGLWLNGNTIYCHDILKEIYWEMQSEIQMFYVKCWL